MYILLTKENFQELTERISTIIERYHLFTIHSVALSGPRERDVELITDCSITPAKSALYRPNSDGLLGCLTFTVNKQSWTIEFPDGAIEFLSSGRGFVVQQSSGPNTQLIWTFLAN